MKILFSVLSAALFTVSARAESCKATVEARAERLNGDLIQVKFVHADVSTKLRHYIVEKMEEYADDSSSWSISRSYLVSATGTQEKCIIESVKAI